MSDTFVEVVAGTDAGFAQMISAQLDADGVDHRLVLAGDPYSGLEHTSPHRLVVRAVDEAVVRCLVNELQLPSSQHVGVPSLPLLFRLQGMRRVFAWLLVLSFVLPALVLGAEHMLDTWF